MSPPPELPRKKPTPPESDSPPPVVTPTSKGEKLEGIDLDDFDDADKVAGIKIEPAQPAAPPPAVKPPAPPAPPLPVRPVKVAPVAPPPRPPAPQVVAQPPRPPQPPAAAVPVVRAPPPSAPAPPPPAAPSTPAQPPAPPVPAAPASAYAPPPPYAAAPPGAPPIYIAPPYGYPPQPVYYPQPAYYPPPYGYPPQPVYYPQPIAYPALRARVWHTREGLAQLNGAAAVGLCTFLLISLQRAFEAATGVTDAPGSRAAAALGFQALSVLLVIVLALAASLAIVLGASGLYRLYKGRSEFGDGAPGAYRHSAKLLAASAMVPTAVMVLGWFYLDNVQHTLPGSGTISDAGLARLWDHYRAVVFAGALAGLAGAFLLAKGLEGPASAINLATSKRAYRLFAVEFVAAAAVNAAAVLVTFFAVMVPPSLATQASPPYALLLLLPGPVIAAHSLFQLRMHLAASLKEAERLARAKPAQAPPNPFA